MVPKIVTSKSKYIKQFEFLHDSAVGVVFTPTSEPFAAIKTLKEYCVARQWTFSLWRLSEGWTVTDTKSIYAGAEPKDQIINGTKEINSALAALDADKERVDNFPFGFGNQEDSINVMMWLHHFIDNPMIIQTIANYAHNFSSTGKRLIILTFLYQM